MTVHMPPMAPAQQRAWHALFDLHQRKPTGWTLVGGQMVHLHCAERGAPPSRPTDDLDTVLDVRAEPQILWSITRELASLGFEPAGTTPDGHQHRWVQDGAQIDILLPANVGERARSRAGYAGGTTIETKGGQQALSRSEDLAVQVGGREGTIRRPNLLGSLVSKAAAYGISLDTGRDRHLMDIASLSALVFPKDKVHQATPRDRQHIDAALAALESQPRILASVEGAEEGLARLRLALSRPPDQGGGGERTDVRRVPRGARSGGQFARWARGDPDVRL